MSAGPICGFGGSVVCLDCVHAFEWQQIQNPSRPASLKLSASFLPNDRKNKVFDGVPYDLMWCFANNLPYKPDPFVNLCHACMGDRDQQAAKYFSKSTAPDYLLCEHSAQFRRNMFTETPLAWSIILGCYQPKSYEAHKYLLLLEKTSKPILPEMITGEKFYCHGNIWYAVPNSKNPLYCSFDLQPNLLGRITRLFYKLPSISMNIKYLDGHVQNFKLVPGVLKEGILINFLPEDMQALRLMFENKTEQPVIGMELIGPGLPYYQTPIMAVWKKQANKIIESQQSPICPNPATVPINQFSVPYVFVYSIKKDTAVYNAARVVPKIKKSDDEWISLTLAVIEKDPSIYPTVVFLQIDNGRLIKTACGIKLLEIGGRLPTREAMMSGFMTCININDLKPGLHTIQAVCRSSKDNKWYRIPCAAQFLIE